jgi:putative flavoprotein involved in K+ transport
MRTTDTIIIGAGQAGLAMSRCLTDRGIDHVVLERGLLAERWRSERWDSLRLLTPNWMSRLPVWSYDGPNPDGFMTAAEFVTYLEHYARSYDAPIEDDCAVEQLAPSLYRNPADLPDGGVLVVGASATGIQLADELHVAGRRVVLAVGGHSRLPRRYRGMDIYWWLERIGNFDRTIDQMPDPTAARRQPSLQLVGRPGGRPLDLTTLQAAGAHLAGRVTGADGHHVEFADDLARSSATADRRMRRVLAEIDRHIDASGLSDEVLPPEPVPPLRPGRSPDRLDLRAAGIGSVVWATGHRRSYPWLSVPVLDEAGEIRQRRGVTPAPGLYVLGQLFQHFRSSNFIDGVGRDATFIADHLTSRTTPARHQ